MADAPKLTADDLREIRAKCAAATPGPWWFLGNDPPHSPLTHTALHRFIGPRGHVILTIRPTDLSHDGWPPKGLLQELNDALFVAESRTVVPLLLDEIARLKAELAQK